MKTKEGGVMNKEREAFEEWYCRSHTGLKQSDLAKFRTLSGYSFSDSLKINVSWEAWQAAKAQAVPEGFVLVPKEPYAYLIKHKLWKKDSDPEIFLAVDFLGDDGIEKDKLTACTPLYLGDDEAQEQAND